VADVRIVPQAIVLAGAAPAFTAGLSLANVYLVANNGATFIEVKKTGAGSCVVTVATPRVVDSLAVAEHTFTVIATTGDMVVGPFPPDTFNDPFGDLRITFSEITGLSMGAFRM
jgi:hypothetical protein